MFRVYKHKSVKFRLLAILSAMIMTHTAVAVGDSRSPQRLSFVTDMFMSSCNEESLQKVADESGTGIVIKEIVNITPGLKLPGGARFFSETDTLPGYCQVSGSYVTNPVTGKTANFLATLPQSWNGKYLQYGCFSHCGFFLFNDASHPMVNLVAQGRPGDSLRKGYASFSTDEGHTSRELMEWAVKDSGRLDQEAINDFFYRATREMATRAKAFTETFYSTLSGDAQRISRSYFTGCSGGGRDGMVAASYFPEAFDGIIVGSPYADMVGVNLHRAAQEMVLRRPHGGIPEKLLETINSTVLSKCDELDGVADGIIQNPAACDFDPARDLPSCEGKGAAKDCFSQQQINSLSTILAAVTDEAGKVIQPGMSVSDLQILAPDSSEALDNEVLRVFAFGNDPGFSLDELIHFGGKGDGGLAAFRAMVPREKAVEAREAVRMGTGSFPENAEKFIRQDRKMLIWHNLSDERLTPYMSFNYYNQLADQYGGFQKLQKNVRLFSLPGTGHCSMNGTGPTSFDALTAMEAWVEQGRPPNALVAAKYPDGDFSQSPSRTMPLCKFPEMAWYKGEGNTNDAKNWYCPKGDRSMLEVKASGKRAGVIPVSDVQ